MSTSQSSPSASKAVSKEQQIFEFTKRKRWADLLITELNDVITLVLSETCQVLYCGNAVTELLGWRDDELADSYLIELMNPDDRTSFQLMFMQSISNNTEILAYCRLQCKNDFYVCSDYTSAPREVLFEIKGHPHFLPDSTKFLCYFAMAKPYPSRNTAMLNTFLELKMENERLQQRILELRTQSATLSAAEPMPFSQPHPRAPLPHGYYGRYEDMGNGTPGTPIVGFDTNVVVSAPRLGEDDEGDANGPRNTKRLKRVYGTEQHVCVTCGRTDSPEWRKGPTGPKTLCNACGLRWAKKVRKTGEAEGEGDITQQASGSGTVF
ncbi:Cutinase gene palindrome-binding protein [Grifola frondosa]|uniref:Cutinase gene palindrome-binding protein n=1 Tax=Grifola frondosa TaxID=5627 RepID=A0A1C7LN63_GRIFR|nr:Cutinase gene palindrome-binding protein [Grifola frondosa]